MERFGHWLDAFEVLHEIARQGDQADDLRAWAWAVALLTGQLESFRQAWGDYRLYFTVDVPHRTVELRQSTDHAYGQLVLFDRYGQAYDHWMVRSL